MLPPDTPNTSDTNNDANNDANDTTDDNTYTTFPGNLGGPGNGAVRQYTPPRSNPLPLPYDDIDPTYQSQIPNPPPQPPAYQQRPSAPYAQLGQAGLPVPYQPRVPVRLPQPQPYPQPYQPPVVVVQQKQKRRSWFSVTCSVMVILLLMLCGLLGIGLYNGIVNAGHAVGTQVSTAPAYFTLAAFCGAEKVQAYSIAYQQFSTNLQQQFTEDAFTKQSQKLDTQNGLVTSCDRAGNSNATVNGSRVTILVDVTRTFPSDTGDANAGKNSDTQGNIILLLEGNDWHVDQVDAALGLI